MPNFMKEPNGAISRILTHLVKSLGALKIISKKKTRGAVHSYLRLIVKR